jgi:hypothetical protein
VLDIIHADRPSAIFLGFFLVSVRIRPALPLYCP